MNTPRTWLVIPAAGTGRRMGSDRPKQYLSLGSQLILDLAIASVLDHAVVAGCMVALGPKDEFWPRTSASRDSRVECCRGGKARADSVFSALQALGARAAADDWVLVHDAARPCLHPDDLGRLLTGLARHPVGGLLATPVTDTLKKSTPGGDEVLCTVDRNRLWRALTPQMFRYGLLRNALATGLAKGSAITDEASAIELAGQTPCIVEGRPDNIKVTVQADLALADFILSRF